MGWREKELEKHRVRKMIDQVMTSPEYRERRAVWERQFTLHAFREFCLMTCDFLELRHNYKKNGMMNFLKFAVSRMGYVGQNDKYFDEMAEYFLNEFGLDVMKELGLEITEKDLK